MSDALMMVVMMRSRRNLMRLVLLLNRGSGARLLSGLFQNGGLNVLSVGRGRTGQCLLLSLLSLYRPLYLLLSLQTCRRRQRFHFSLNRGPLGRFDPSLGERALWLLLLSRRVSTWGFLESNSLNFPAVQTHVLQILQLILVVLVFLIR